MIRKLFSCKKGNANVEEHDLSIIMDDFLVDWLLILTLSFFYCEVCLIVNHHRHLSWIKIIMFDSDDYWHKSKHMFRFMSNIMIFIHDRCLVYDYYYYWNFLGILGHLLKWTGIRLRIWMFHQVSPLIIRWQKLILKLYEKVDTNTGSFLLKVN